MNFDEGYEMTINGQGVRSAKSIRVADHWGQLAGDAQRQGTLAPVIDGLLAATALHHHLTMVTRNVQDFMIHNNIQAFNPWDTP
jgi:predicted nucleic acid-binding protein